jgi:AcrR family transcriptional regulator
MSVKNSDRRAPSSTGEAILAAARRQLLAGRPLSIQAVAAEAGVSRQTVHSHFRGASGLRATLAADGLAVPPNPTEPTEERLVEAGVRLLSRPGGGLIAIEAIAAEAGLTKGAFYHHFDDRGEFLQAVARRVSPVDELRQKLEPGMNLPAREGLIAIARGYYAAMSARADLIRNLAANSARDPQLTAVVMNEIIGQGAPLMLAWFQLQVERGYLRPVNPSLVIQELFGPVFLMIVLGPTVFEEIARYGILPAVDNVEAYVDLVLEGIAAPQPPQPPQPAQERSGPVSRPAGSSQPSQSGGR